MVHPDMATSKEEPRIRPCPSFLDPLPDNFYESAASWSHSSQHQCISGMLTWSTSAIL